MPACQAKNITNLGDKLWSMYVNDEPEVDTQSSTSGVERVYPTLLDSLSFLLLFSCLLRNVSFASPKACGPRGVPGESTDGRHIGEEYGCAEGRTGRKRKVSIRKWTFTERRKRLLLLRNERFQNVLYARRERPIGAAA